MEAITSPKSNMCITGGTNWSTGGSGGTTWAQYGVCARGTATNRKALLRIVEEDMFGSASNPCIRNSYDIYINCLYSRENGKHEEGDYPFELDGRLPKSSTDLLDVYFDADGPGMKLVREGKWDRLCAWY